MNNKHRMNEANKEVSRRLIMSNNRRVESIRFAEMSCSDDTARKPKLSNLWCLVNEPGAVDKPRAINESRVKGYGLTSSRLFPIRQTHSRRGQTALGCFKILKVRKGNCSHGWICNNRICKIQSFHNEQ